MPKKTSRDTVAARVARGLNQLQRDLRGLPAEDFHDAIDECLRRLTEQRREVMARAQIMGQLEAIQAVNHEASQ